MTTKPVLLWPKSRSEIAVWLGSNEEHFLVVETNKAAEIRHLYQLTADTPVFDPFPIAGTHYRACLEHVQGSGCRFHIAGLAQCRTVLVRLQDRSIARSSFEELLLALGYLDPKARRTMVVIPPDPWWLVWWRFAIAELRKWWEAVAQFTRHHFKVS
ncbi:MAG TPA: hypothetical protein VFB45_21015 [Pseudolabrys sp.]|nr:hypothetical protein [Pseudolabrys sp.]